MRGPVDSIRDIYCASCECRLQPVASQPSLPVPSRAPSLPVAGAFETSAITVDDSEDEPERSPDFGFSSDDSEDASNFDDAWRDQIIQRAFSLLESATRFSARLHLFHGNLSTGMLLILSLHGKNPFQPNHLMNGYFSLPLCCSF